MVRKISDKQRCKIKSLRHEKKVLVHRVVETEGRLRVTQCMLENALTANKTLQDRVMELQERSVSTPTPVSKAGFTTDMPTLENKIEAEAKKGSLTLQQDEMKRNVNVGQQGPNITGAVAKQASLDEEGNSMDSPSTPLRCEPITSSAPAAKNEVVVVNKPQIAYRRGLFAVGKSKSLPQVQVESVKSNPPCQHHMFRLSKHARQHCLKCQELLGPRPCWGCFVCGNVVHLRCLP